MAVFDPITPGLGAEVRGVGLAEAVADPEVGTAVKAAFVEHRVLVFRDQDIDRETHKAFGRLFGDLHVHPSKAFGGKGDPEIFTVRTTDATTQVNGGRWHTDVSCETVPPAASILRLVDAPPSGGDTVFADTHRAFTTLSEPLQHMLVGLDAFHDGMRDLRWYGITPRPGEPYPDYPSTTHPVVIAHPTANRPHLFVNEAFTERFDGLTDLEGQPILDMLFNHVARTPALHCRVRWAPNTVVMWDNWAVQHHAVWDYAPHQRRGERVSVLATDRPARWPAG